MTLCGFSNLVFFFLPSTYQLAKILLKLLVSSKTFRPKGKLWNKSPAKKDLELIRMKQPIHLFAEAV